MSLGFFVANPGSIIHISETQIKCGGWDAFTQGSTRCDIGAILDAPMTVAQITWELKGWKHTKRYGWLCPKCARAHTKLWRKKKKGKK